MEQAVTDAITEQHALTGSPFRVAILGTRGVPARYGGFETFAEELGARLVERGHEVVVYARRALFSGRVQPFSHRGMQVRCVPTIMQKYLETPLHAFFSMIDLFRSRPDVVLLCNAANSPFAWLIRLQGIPVAINVDGIERQRSKWNGVGKLWYRLGELCSVLFASRVIADAEVIAEYYRSAYRCTPTVLTYGGSRVDVSAGETLSEFDLEPGRYLLYVSRLEPENNALGVIQAYRRLKTELPLVVVGDAPYANEYKRRLREAADERVIFTGFQFGQAYRELLTNCCLYVQATEVGGTHPALVEAMTAGKCIVANGTPENREVLGDAGMYYPRNEFGALTDCFQELLNDEGKRRRFGAAAERRASEHYSWSRVADGYEQLFQVLCGPKLKKAQ